MAVRLERRRPTWAIWVHPFAVVGAFWFVGATAFAFGDAAGLVLGAVVIVVGALLTVALAHGVHLAAVVVGGAAWDFWLYGELAFGPVAGLALTLALGMGTIALGLFTWRRRGGKTSLADAA